MIDKINPFIDSGVSNYYQYKNYDFVPFNNFEILKNRILGMIRDITKFNHPHSDKTIIIGQRGIGKTSILYYIKDMLEDGGLKVILLSILIENAEHFREIAKEDINSISEKPIFILIDFPDTIELKQFKRFLEFLWALFTHPNSKNIHLIFAMNPPHFEKSFGYSEIFGKFIKHTLEELDREETEALIKSRLDKIDTKIEDVFDYESISTIHNYSNGIPRNIISACNIIFPNINGKQITIDKTEKILGEKYIEQVLLDRIEDKEERRIYGQMIDILKNDFKGNVQKQNDYVDKIKEKIGISYVTSLKNIDNMIKWGVINYTKGGEKRKNKILYLN